MDITVYSKPRCVQCSPTKRELRYEGVQYTDVDVSEDAAAFEFIMGPASSRAPVVVVRDDDGRITDHWAGFRPDRIKAVVRR